MSINTVLSFSSAFVFLPAHGVTPVTVAFLKLVQLIFTLSA